MSGLKPTPITYGELCQIRLRLTKRTFREVHSSEETSDEASFESPVVNGFIVKVLTACSRKKTEACCAPSLFPGTEIVSGLNDPIMGQVLIFKVQTGQEVYSSIVYRTPTFVEDILKKTWLAWLRVRRPPYCPECKKILMEIYQKQVDGKTWWGCYRKAAHKSKMPITMQWDITLSGEERAIARAMRADRIAIQKAINMQTCGAIKLCFFHKIINRQSG